MDKKTFQLKLLEYFEDKLEQGEKIQFEKLIREDPSLRKEVDSLKKIIKLSNLVQYTDPPANYWNNYLPRLREKIDRESKKTGRVSLKYVWAPGLAFIFLIILFVNRIDQNQTSEQITIDDKFLEQLFENDWEDMSLFNSDWGEIIEGDKLAEVEKLLLGESWEIFDEIFNESKQDVNEDLENLSEEEINKLINMLKGVQIIL